MINRVNTLNINFGKNPQNNYRTVVRRYQNNDEFLSSKGKNKMQTDKYNQINPNFQKEATINTIEKRIRSMPIMMDKVFDIVRAYLSEKTTREFFVKTYQDEIVPLYRRIKYGNCAEEYAENYKPFKCKFIYNSFICSRKIF